MAARDKLHLFVPNAPETEAFTLSGSGGGDAPEPFSGDRGAHGRRLQRELKAALPPPDEEDVEGTYITFVSFPGLELALESLDPQRSGDQPELVAVAEEATAAGSVQMATVFVPEGKKEYFIKRLAQYVAAVSEDKTRNAALVEGIASIRRATIRELWTDPQHLFPPDDGTRYWWEIWLRSRDGDELQRLTDYAAEHDLATSPHFLGFGERTVALLHATTEELTQTFDALDDLAELRRPHDVASFLSSLPAAEQAEWVEELRGRLQAAGVDAPVVCVVDTGIQDGHPLLVESLDPVDIHVADASWQTKPVFGHGTEMAGIALFGDLHAAIVSAQKVDLMHGLESVKFLPDSGDNPHDLYGAVTARAVDRPEIQAPARSRIFMLAVTARRPSGSTQVEAGKPSSWSATIDALAFGRAIDDSQPRLTYLDRNEPRSPRLFVISAGNIRDVQAGDDHLARSAVEPVEDPAHAWNAITVGAYTDMDDMSGAHPSFLGYVPIAQRGELAPVSRTSVLFDGKKWPFKPDVVAEGGNVAASPDGSLVDTPENLAILTTRLHALGQGAFVTTRDTSAATAHVAAIAADVQAAYPAIQPETVRGLVVHSARWTPTMWDRLNSSASKAERINWLRHYGMGVPDLSRALRSASDALTLVVESEIHPFEREGNSNKGKVSEMNLHPLPWPKTELEALGNVEVHLRVTLSYFVEPNPSSRGWTGRYIYPSHGLRFAVRRPEDSIESFRKSINTRARDEDEKPTPLSTEKGWFFGANQQQSAGSLHTDVWTGRAIELANKEAVAVYPVAGWWKDRGKFDQSDQGVSYSLIVSIESPSVEVDLWTPVAQQITPEIAIET